MRAACDTWYYITRTRALPITLDVRTVDYAARLDCFGRIFGFHKRLVEKEKLTKIDDYGIGHRWLGGG